MAPQVGAGAGAHTSRFVVFGVPRRALPSRSGAEAGSSCGESVDGRARAPITFTAAPIAAVLQRTLSKKMTSTV